MGGADAIERIFQHQAMLRLHPEQPGGMQERVGAWLAARHIIDGHHHVEPMAQAGLAEVPLGRYPGVGGGDGDRQADAGEVVEQRDGARL